VAFICAECQILLLPLDVGNFRAGSNVDMKIFWYIIYMTSAFFIVVILPFALFYYESDEDQTFVRRTLSIITIESEVMHCLQV
jgi:LMBR1 domain-containing protein 1